MDSPVCGGLQCLHGAGQQLVPAAHQGTVHIQGNQFDIHAATFFLMVFYQEYGAKARGGQQAPSLLQ
jgi:hypothetical protein